MDLNSFIEAATPLRALGVIVSQNGREIARHLWEGSCRRNIYSASKSFTSAAVGIAVREGLLSLEEPLTCAFPHELPPIVSENLKKATVRDLLTMCLGQGEGFLGGDDRPYYTDPDWVRGALAVPFPYEPGSHFFYSNVGPYLAGILVQRRAGCDLIHYLLPRMLEPMGIQRPTWETDPQGNTFGAGGMFLSIDELHKFGLLCLQEGALEGRQLIPADWIAAAASRQVENDVDPYGYGYLFWGGPEGSFRADGKYGQFSIFLRDKNAVITVMAECRCQGKLLKTIFAHLYHQL